MSNAGLLGLLLIVLFVVLQVLQYAVTRRQHPLREPLTWFFSFWLLGAALLSLPLFAYYEEFDFGSGALVLLFLASYGAGDLAASFWFASKRKPSNTSMAGVRSISVRKVKRNLSLLVWGGVAGISLLTVNSFLSGGIGLVDRLDLSNAQAVRSLHMTGEESRIGPLFGIATAGAAFGGVAVAVLMFLRGFAKIELSPFLRFGTILWIVLTIFFGMIVTGSRMAAIFGIAISGISYAEGRWAAGKSLIEAGAGSRLWKALLVLPILLAAAWFMATSFLEKRVGGQDAERLLYTTHRASLTNATRNAVADSPNLKYFLLSLSYFSTPIPTLTYYMGLPDGRAPGPLWGEYDFPAPARWIRRLTFNADPVAWERARIEVFRPLGDIGFGTNVWATLPRDLAADFGKAGAAIFLVLLGFLTQRCHLQQRLNPSAAVGVMTTYLRIVGIFSGLVSVFYIPLIQWGLIASAVVVFLFRSTDIQRFVEVWQDIETTHARHNLEL